MEEHFDAVVIGSGFGGSVIACRLAEAGKSVCVFERGKPYKPGDFARSPHEMRDNFWDPAAGKRGLFDVWSFRTMESVVSAGLGGGSLIYANVLIRKDERWFVRDGTPEEHYEYWPISRDELDPFYDKAETMLGAQFYPYGDTPKTLAMQAAAEALDIRQLERTDIGATQPEIDTTKALWYRPLLAVTFATGHAPATPGQAISEPVRNLHGVDRQTCRLCGECDIGCNYGSKNTLDLTYLTLAQLHGAVIRTLREAKTIEPHGRGYRVGFVTHIDDGSRAEPDAGRCYVTCDKLFVAAGTFGTNYLLLRNRTNLPALSERLGRRFSGNGDLLAFVFKATQTDPATKRRTERAIEGSRGPVITSTFRIPDALDGASGRGFYLQDAGYPSFVNWLVEESLVPGDVSRLARFALRRVAAYFARVPRSRIGGDLATLIGKAGVSNDSMPLLGMGRDIPNGVLSLQRSSDDQPLLELAWDDVASRGYLNRAEAFAARVAEKLGGTFVLNPLTKFLNRLITVHPLGGAAMSRCREEGVVDRWGEVWGHPNLYVVDGSVMPGPVGANPSLTIAAFAERCAQYVISGGNVSPARPVTAPPSARR